jgi:hypothetical protein
MQVLLVRSDNQAKELHHAVALFDRVYPSRCSSFFPWCLQPQVRASSVMCRAKLFVHD